MIELTRTNGQRPVDRLSDIDKHIHVWETFVGGEMGVSRHSTVNHVCLLRSSRPTFFPGNAAL